MTLAGTLELAAEFRKRHPDTPLILMGYYNPIYIYGNDRFIADALAAGVDGLIIVDLPPEEDTELCLPAKDAGLKFIRLVRQQVTKPASRHFGGGQRFCLLCIGSWNHRHQERCWRSISDAYQRIRAQTELPIVAGFGIRTPAQAAEAASLTDGAVVGSAVVDIIANNLTDTPQEGIKMILFKKLPLLSANLRKLFTNRGMP